MSTVADMVIADPRTARAFEQFGIDYCCHGDRSLTAACEQAGVSEDSVRAALDSVASEPPDDKLPDTNVLDVAGLIGHIVTTHHVYLRTELPRLEDLFVKVINAHAEEHPEVRDVAATFRELTAELMPHLMKEERVLFPLTIELLGAVTRPEFHCGSVTNPISMMHVEHDRAGELLASLRRQTDGYEPPDYACPTWRALWDGLAELEADTHRHVHLENNVLFPEIMGLEASLSPSGSPRHG